MEHCSYVRWVDIEKRVSLKLDNNDEWFQGVINDGCEEAAGCTVSSNTKRGYRIEYHHTMGIRLYIKELQLCWPTPYLPTCSTAPYINWNAFHIFPGRPPHFALKSLTRVGPVRI